MNRAFESFCSRGERPEKAKTVFERVLEGVAQIGLAIACMSRSGWSLRYRASR
jgi:hypothetical protein